MKDIRIYSIEELDALPPFEWLVRGIIGRGTTTLITGPGNSYKSFFALNMAVHVALGQDLYGHTVNPIGPVIFAAGHVPDKRFIHRLSAQCQEIGVRPTHLTGKLYAHNFQKWQVGGASPMEVMADHIDELNLDVPPAMIVLDCPWMEYAQEPEAGSVVRAIRYMRDLEALRDRFPGVAVVTVQTHSDSEGLHEMKFWVDTVITTSVSRGYLSVKLAKQRNGPDYPVVESLDYLPTQVRLEGSPGHTSIVLRPSGWEEL